MNDTSDSLSAKTIALVLCLSLAFPMPGRHFVHANDRAGTPTVVHGGADFARDGDNLTVTTATNRTIISWDNFGVPGGSATHFAQPGAGAATLNRVTGSLPTHINGLLSSNGAVYVANAQGVVVGTNGVVQTDGGFVASTLDVSNGDFIDGAAGSMRFASSGALGDGLTANFGRIESSRGDVFLIGRRVVNAGNVSAPRGTAGFAAGDESDDLPGRERVGADGGGGDGAELRGRNRSGQFGDNQRRVSGTAGARRPLQIGGEQHRDRLGSNSAWGRIGYVTAGADDIDAADARAAGRIGVYAKGDVTLTAGAAGLAAQIGHTWTAKTETVDSVATTYYTLNADRAAMGVMAGGAVALKAGTEASTGKYAQIGHGGGENAGSYATSSTTIAASAAPVSVLASGEVELAAGNLAGISYAQIGHGGALYHASGDPSLTLDAGDSALTVAAEGDLTLANPTSSTNNSYAQIGHGGATRSSDGDAETRIAAAGSAIAIAVGGDATVGTAVVTGTVNSYAQIGHGGAAYSQDGGATTSVGVSGSAIAAAVDGGLTVNGSGATNSYAQVGYGGIVTSRYTSVE